MNEIKEIAIVGSTGLVGQELEKLLEIPNIKKFASSKKGNANALQKDSFDEIDLAFFCTSSEVAKEWIPIALQSNTRVIDLSSAHRKDPDVPLVIPEINGALLKNDPKLISSPNCTASILLMPLYPLHKLFNLKQIIVSSYQAFSGAGRSARDALLSQTEDYLATGNEGPYAFNLFLHPGDEEERVRFEVRKILGTPNLPISATCVRVPTIRAHSISLFAEFHEDVDLEEAKAALHEMSGVQLATATPQSASFKEDVFVGRIRQENPKALHLWIVGDQILKGAALNAKQIAKYLLALYTLEV